MTSAERDELLIKISEQLSVLIARQAASDGAADPDKSELLEFIYRDAGNSVFTATDLVDRAKLAKVDGDASLENAILRAFGALSSRRLGTFLANHEGQTISGFVIKRVRNTRDGFEWQIAPVKTCESEMPRTRRHSKRHLAI